MNKNKLRWVMMIFFFIFSLLVIPLAIYFYQFFQTPNIAVKRSGPVEVYIYPETQFKDLIKDLERQQAIGNGLSFAFVAQLLDYQQNLKTGHYFIEANSSNLEAVRKLRAGHQSPVKITFNNIRLKSEIAQKIAPQLMMTQEALEAKLYDSTFIKDLGFDSVTIACMFLPDTYEYYWNISPDAFIRSMKEKYDLFWKSNNRLVKAKEIGLTPIQVSILASIVDSESNNPSEKAKIAGLYINRLNKNMLLQADPTVKFALGDFSLKRVLNKHLTVDSPYNTYKYAGLPPGPIRIPEHTTIDAVLNYERHQYLYMCANPDMSESHAFAKTLSQHNINAANYQRALNQLGIK